MLSKSNFDVYRRVGLPVTGLVMLLLFAYVVGSMTASEEYGFLSLVVVLAPLGAIFVFKRPAVGFALIFFLIPLGPLTRVVGGERAVTFALAVLLLGLYISKVLVLREKIKFDRVSLLGSAFVAWAVIGSIWAFEPQLALSRAVFRMSIMVGLYILALNYCRNERELDVMTLSFIAGAMLAAVWTVFAGTSHGGTGISDRMALVGSYNPNGFSRVLGFALILAFYYFYKTNSRLVKLVIPFGVIAMLYVIVGAQSRSVWIALPASFLITSVILYRNSKIVSYSIKTVVVLIFVAAFVYLSGIISESVIERFETLSFLFSENPDFNKVSSRTEVWKVGLEMVKNTMPFGVGFSNYKYAFDQYGYAVDYSIGPKGAHNTYLAILAETGVIGFALFMGIFICVFRNIRLIADPRTLFIYSWLFIFFMIGNLTGTYYLNPWFWFVLFLISFQGRLQKYIRQPVLR